MLPPDFPSDAENTILALLVFIAKHWREEVAIITGAPTLSFLTLLITTFFIWLGFRLYYKRELAQIPDLKASMKAKNEEVVKISEELREQHKKGKATQRTNIELEAKIAAIENTRPHLEAEGIVIYRTVHQPILPRELPQAYFRKEFGSFALLHITNKPRSTNQGAIALDLYASISYFDAQENKLFPTIPGIWITPTDIDDVAFIGPISPRWSALKPYDSTHLGIALGYLHDEPFLCGALSNSSPQYVDWLDTNFFLSDLRFPIRVHVILGCHEFQTTRQYRLTISRTKEQLILEEIEL